MNKFTQKRISAVILSVLFMLSFVSIIAESVFVYAPANSDYELDLYECELALYECELDLYECEFDLHEYEPNYLHIYEDDFEFVYDCSYTVLPFEDTLTDALTTPIISLDGTRLTWSVGENTDFIHIYFESVVWSSASTDMPFFDLRFLELPIGSHQIQVRALRWSYDVLYGSELSDAVTFVSDGSSVCQFDAPTISIDGNILSWNIIEHAQIYDIYVNGMFVRGHWAEDIGTASLDLRQLFLPNGTHQIQIRISTIFGMYLSSELSNPVTFVQDFPMLTTPTIALDGTRLTWSMDENTDFIHIYFESVVWGSASADMPFFDLRFLELPIGSHQIQVRALRWSYDVLYGSELSNAVTFVSDGSSACQFEVPAISIDAHVLYWNKIDHAQFYHVYVDGVAVWWHWSEGNDIVSFDLRQLFLPNGTHQIQIRTHTRYGMYLSSGLSNSVTFIQDLPMLNAPIITINNSRLTWLVDENAYSIHIYVDGTSWSSAFLDVPFFDLRFLDHPVGSHQIQARAVSWGDDLSWSELSNAVTFISDGSSAYQFDAPAISIDGHVLSWNLIEHAQIYGIYVNGMFVRGHWSEEIGTASLDLRQLFLSNGTHQIQVRTYARFGVHLSSGLSNSVTFMQDLPMLNAPIIALDETRLIWIVDENIDFINIYAGGTIWSSASADSPFFDLRFLELPIGPNQIQARAVSGLDDFSWSELSNTITFISDGSSAYQRFDAPTISIDRHILTWNIIEHVQIYDIYVDGVAISWHWLEGNDITSFDLRRLHLPIGTFQIQVRAYTRHGMYLSSELSNAVNFTVRQQIGNAPGPGFVGGQQQPPQQRPIPQVEVDVPSFGLRTFAPIIQGFLDNTFRGAATMSREEFVTILHRLGSEPYPFAANENTLSFNDVASDRWSFNAIEWAVYAGIIEAGGNFRPSAPITRVEMAIMLVLLDNLEEYGEDVFTDIEDHEYVEYILKAVGAGIFEGFPDGTFRPDSSATRNEVVTALVRYLLGGSPTDEMLEGLEMTLIDVPRTHWAHRYILIAVNGFTALAAEE